MASLLAIATDRLRARWGRPTADVVALFGSAVGRLPGPRPARPRRAR